MKTGPEKSAWVKNEVLQEGSILISRTDGGTERQFYWNIMKHFPNPLLIIAWCAWLLSWHASSSFAATAQAEAQGAIIAVSGKVEHSKAGTVVWAAAAQDHPLGVGDKVRTSVQSRATIRLPNLTVLRLNERTTVEIQKPAGTAPASKSTLSITAGAAYFFGRGKPGEIEIRTPTATGAIRGTEFNLEVKDDGATVFTLVEGEMDVMNELGSVPLKPGEQASATSGSKPRVSPALQVANVIQWSLYYPGVLDPGELEFSAPEAQALASSLKAYKEGDLLGALDALPPPEGSSQARKIYESALLVFSGQVDQATQRLPQTSQVVAKNAPLIAALETLVATVKNQPAPGADQDLGPSSTASPSLLLARSYWLQSRFQLDEALRLTEQAIKLSPEFGFAWERLAELQFGFGRVPESKEALKRALELSPKNAQAWALQGFLYAAENKIPRARESFEQAIRLDPNLGNAWLGRGLSKIRKGDVTGGVEDLQTASALEPNRGMLRSYLGKAFGAAHDSSNALRELRQALLLDPGDPTGWLYSALLKYDHHQINGAVEDLEHALTLNTNRVLYRSRFLLDQDKAVSSVNLANFYLRAGLADVSVQEASRAVVYDYANASAHRFLADSFNALRDPTRFNLRHESVWFNETLLSDLLSPVGGGSLSQHVSQYEYSKLLERDRFGFNSSTSARSDGQYIQYASQFGTFGNTSYSLDLEYQSNEGVRPNNELSRIEWYSKFKQQLTAQDSIFFLAKYQDYTSGDNFQYYDPNKARPKFNYDEFQSPYLVGAYHREWSPGIHTLLLAGGLNNEQRFGDSIVSIPLLEKNAAGQITRIRTPTFDVDYGSDFSFYNTELNQIAQFDRNTLVFGVRYQVGEFENRNRLDVTQGSAFGLLFPKPATDASFTEDFERTAGYAYYTRALWDQLYLTAGFSYDWMRFPLNHRLVPLSGVESEDDRLSPKASLVWIPNGTISLRAMYSRFLGGVSFDESYRLEPTQLAGFGQAYRTIISESIVGSVSGPRYEVAGTGIDLKFKSRTYAGIQAELLRSQIDSPVGAFNLPLPIRSTTLDRDLDYEEKVASLYVQQLLGEEWSVGGSYTLRDSDLHTVFPEIPRALSASADKTESATMHRINANVLFNHHSGFYSRLDSNWMIQSNRGYTPDIPGDSAHQLDFSIGYRFPRQIGSLLLTLANLTDQDYRLNPLNLYTEMPRERVLMARLRLHF